MSAYYNEIDEPAAQWLRNLIAAGEIADGEVDTRSIADVRPDDLKGFNQCHFFAGIGGWSKALRLAGWPDDRPVWTGSCPCQPFSVAGAQKGTEDERHLWPAWADLIEIRRPTKIFGEQVEAAVRHGWLDLVYSDLERWGYAVGAVVIPAAGVGAPHIRQRLWFVADANHGSEHALLRARPYDSTKDVRGGQASRLERQMAGGNKGESNGLAESDGGQCSRRANVQGRHDSVGPHTGRQENSGDATEHGGASELADTTSEQFDGGRDARRGRGKSADGGQLGNAECEGLEGYTGHGDDAPRRAQSVGSTATPGELSHYWRSCDWLPCRDGKARPVEPGTFPLAHGVPGRVVKLRAYGNAIVPQVAAAFILASE